MKAISFLEVALMVVVVVTYLSDPDILCASVPLSPIVVQKLLKTHS